MAFRLKTLSEITSHPLTRQAPLKALGRYVNFHFTQRLFPYSKVYPWVGSLKLLVRKGWAGVVGNVYTGLYDFEEMGFLIHCLREEDLFVDIGANLGVYSLLAAGICKSRVIAVEPVPSTFRQLQGQIRLNSLENLIETHQIGIGQEAGTLRFSQEFGAMNHVVSHSDSQTNVINVPVKTLDQLTELPARVLKLDCEGYELPVLQGASRFLEQAELQAIIIELNGSGQRYGFADQDIDQLLRQHGFRPYRYWPFSRQLEALSHWRSDQHNTLYIRQAEALQPILAASSKIEVLNQKI